jgi:hypothetical protein
MAETIEEIIEKLGQAQQVSRAELRRRLRRLTVGEIERANQKSGT